MHETFKTALRTTALLLTLLITIPVALAQTPTVNTSKPTFALGEPIGFSWNGGPGNMGDSIILVPKDTPDSKTTGFRGLFLQGRADGSNTLGVVNTQYPAGEYEVRFFVQGSPDVAARITFAIGDPAQGTTEVVAVEPSDTQPPATEPDPPSSSDTEIIGGPTVKTEKPVYRTGEVVRVAFTDAPPEGAYILLVRKGTPIGVTRPQGEAMFAVVNRGVITSTVGMRGRQFFTQPGEYEVRIFTNNFEEFLTSSEFSVR